MEEEKTSRFGSNKSSWPILNDRYQILKLLGKGGFSEVYYAFDLSELKPVACKIHQINKNWQDHVRSNYVKHALRENTVLKIVKHINIVSHFDSVEIDNESFGTILEYCEGLDLGSYLKRQKMIPEKEAKVIIQ